MLQRIRIERLLVVLIAVHSYLVGLMLFFTPLWALSFAGWTEGPGPLFFLRQAGIFHFVLATGYLIEYSRGRSIRLLLTAKTMAFVFLLGESLVSAVPWSIPFCALSDGAMAAAVLLVHRWAAAPNSTPAVARERTA